MKALRIHLKQSSANYRREETIDNKMTYPLPPYSTVIGALHNACKYTKYHKMDISIQGTYGGMGKEVYFDNCFHNKIDDDRKNTTLVKMLNKESLSNAFIEVARAKSGKCHFKNGENIQIINEDEFKAFQQLSGKTRTNSDYKILTKGPKFYEVLYDVELIIHVASSDETLNCIYNHLGELTSIGRSEDFVELIEEDTGFTELHAIKHKYRCGNSAYINVNTKTSQYTKKGSHTDGTRYLLNKNYILSEDGKKRIFNKKLVKYVSDFSVNEKSEGVFIDDNSYIVSLI
ncbi:MAG: CRISPR-associated protein Cas5 [Clostridium sp.]|nr:CRISPR-associated protein Cas5 [Clostridium sp.]